MAQLVLVRHGQSQWNLENKFTGWVDVDLSLKGEEEALSAGRKLREMVFQKAYTSDLKRAQRTLRIILEEIKQSDIPIEKDQALNERHYGDLQGLNKAATAKKFGEKQVHIWRRSYDVAPPNGESLKDTAERTLPYFSSKILPEVRNGRNILVSAHGNSLRAIVMNLDQLTKDQVMTLNLGTGVPIVYDIDGEGKVIGKKEL